MSGSRCRRAATRVELGDRPSGAARSRTRRGSSDHGSVLSTTVGVRAARAGARRASGPRGRIAVAGAEHPAPVVRLPCRACRARGSQRTRASWPGRMKAMPARWWAFSRAQEGIADDRARPRRRPPRWRRRPAAGRDSWHLAVAPVVLASSPCRRDGATRDPSMRRRRTRRPWKNVRRWKTGCSRRRRMRRRVNSSSRAAGRRRAPSASQEIVVVLAVGVVVAALGAADLVARRRASARPGRGRASRGSCASGARGARRSRGSSVGPSDAAVPARGCRRCRRGCPRRWPRCACAS